MPQNGKKLTNFLGFFDTIRAMYPTALLQTGSIPWVDGYGTMAAVATIGVAALAVLVGILLRLKHSDETLRQIRDTLASRGIS